MSRHFGQIRQAGYVVPDIEAAMDYWSRVLGVGPFFYNPKVPIRNYRYKGESYEPHNSVALANSGPLQIELIQCRNAVPSMYKDFTDAGHSGLQHVAYWTSAHDAHPPAGAVPVRGARWRPPTPLHGARPARWGAAPP